MRARSSSTVISIPLRAYGPSSQPRYWQPRLIARIVTFIAITTFSVTPSLSYLQSGLLSARSAFEVASVKATKAEYQYRGGSCRGTDTKYLANSLNSPPPLGRCLYYGTTLSDLVRSAYQFELLDGVEDLVTGGPAWAKSDRFDVEAKAESPEKTTRKELHLMLQTLLADRFKLRFHRETRKMSGFALVVTKTGPKLKPATGTEERPGTLLPTGFFEW